MKSIFRFFDKLEDKIRGRLSRHPILYALIGSLGIILLWRGITILFDPYDETGIISTVLGLVILMSTGLLVSFFVGDQIIISGIKSEKRTDEKTAEEIKSEEISLRDIREDIGAMRKKMEEICEKVSIKKK